MNTSNLKETKTNQSGKGRIVAAIFGAPGTFARKANIGCLVLMIIGFCISAMLSLPGYLYYRQALKLGCTKQSLILVLKSCEQYWDKEPAGICSLEIISPEMARWDQNLKKVNVSIINGNKQNFLATANYHNHFRMLQIDHQGNLFVKVGECLLDANTISAASSYNELEQQCKKTSIKNP